MKILLTFFVILQINVCSSLCSQSIYERDVQFALKEIEDKAGQFFELKNIDWKKVSVEMSEAAQKVQSDQEHYMLLWRLLARLKDGHASVRQTDATKDIRWVAEVVESGMGIFLSKIDGKLYVKNSFSIAKKAGIKPGSQVLEINGEDSTEWLDQRIRDLSDIISFSSDQHAFFYATHWGMRSEKGSNIRLKIKNHSNKTKTVTVAITKTRQVPEGPAFFPKSAGGKKYGGNNDLHWCRIGETKIGYIHIRRCKGNLPEHIDEALKSLNGVKGIVLDWRGNSGGGFDHDALLGRFIPKGKTTRWGKMYRSAGNHPYGGPIVVIVDATCRSAGETGAGIFKEDGRAYMIGESSTAGMSSRKTMIELPSGKFNLLISVSSNKGRFNKGRGIEGIGVIPHEILSYKVKDLINENDTMIQRAIELIEKGFPDDSVPYQPKRFGWKSK